MDIPVCGLWKLARETLLGPGENTWVLVTNSGLSVSPSTLLSWRSGWQP